jgi:hypothetical protein
MAADYRPRRRGKGDPHGESPHSLFARIYDLLMVPNDRFGLRHQRERLCADATGRVLEIAIGTGRDVVNPVNPPHGPAISTEFVFLAAVSNALL